MEGVLARAPFSVKLCLEFEHKLASTLTLTKLKDLYSYASSTSSLPFSTLYLH